MTRSEQERLVERYLGGEMLSADEEEFFMQVAVDQDLRQTLKAYRIVESAIRKHRDISPAHHDRSRSRIIAMLALSAAAHPAPSHSTPAQSNPTQYPHAAGSGSAAQPPSPRVAGTRFGRHVTVNSAALQWIVGAVAVLAFTVGAFVAAPLLRDTPASTQPAVQAPASKLPVPSIKRDIALPDVVEGSQSANELPITGVSTPNGHEREHANTVLASNAGTAASRTAATRRMPGEAAQRTAPKARSTKANERAQNPVAADPSITNTPAKKPAAAPITVRDSGMNVKMKVDFPKDNKEKEK